MRTLFICLAALTLCAFTTLQDTDPNDFVNPTGTYILKGLTRSHRIYGYSGEIRASLVNDSTVAVSFFMSKGYPGYESATFTASLQYTANRILFVPPSDDGCSICIRFSGDRAVVEQWFTNPRSTCGFPDGAVASRSFSKANSIDPVILDLSGRN